MKAAIWVVLLSVPALSQTPDTHKFFDKPARFSLTASAGIYAADTATTCRNLNAGAQEQWLPTQHCAGVGMWLAGNFAAQTAAAYWLHRHNHHRLERIAEIFAPVGSAAGISYTLKHWR